MTQPVPVSPLSLYYPEHGPGPFTRKPALLGSWWFVVVVRRVFRCEAFPPRIPWALLAISPPGGATGDRGMRERSEADPIRVLLADDHTMFREGIASVLSDYGGMQVVGQTDNDEGAAELARELEPDVVLMQVRSTCPNQPRALQGVASPTTERSVAWWHSTPEQTRSGCRRRRANARTKEVSVEAVGRALHGNSVGPRGSARLRRFHAWSAIVKAQISQHAASHPWAPTTA